MVGSGSGLSSSEEYLRRKPVNRFQVQEIAQRELMHYENY